MPCDALCAVAKPNCMPSQQLALQIASAALLKAFDLLQNFLSLTSVVMARLCHVSRDVNVTGTSPRCQICQSRNIRMVQWSKRSRDYRDYRNCGILLLVSYYCYYDLSQPFSN